MFGRGRNIGIWVAIISLRFYTSRPKLMLALAPGLKRFTERRRILRRTLEDPESYLRDEHEIIAHEPGQGLKPELVA